MPATGGAPQGALAAFEAGGDVAGGEPEGRGGPQDLQAGADERARASLDGVERLVAAQDGAGEGGEAPSREVGEAAMAFWRPVGRGARRRWRGRGARPSSRLGACAVGVEGRHAVLAAAAELGFIRRGGGAEAVEQGLLGVGEAGREGEEVGHRVALGEACAGAWPARPT